MGQSLPIPTDIQSATRTGHQRADGPRMTLDPRPDDDVAVESVPGSDGPQPAAPDSFTAAIVRSKVRTPGMRPHTLERPRLLNWLEEHNRQRLRVITAEAGYGKSTLIADHQRRTGRRMAWLRLEASDVDWVGMLSYLVASVREVIPDFGIGAVNLLQRVGVLNASRDMVLDIILAELESTLTEPLTLVLDDFHVVQDGEDVRAIMHRLIELAPPTLGFIIAGRQHPGTLLARAMSHGEVSELGTQELRFTRAETAHLLGSILGGPLDDDLVQILDERLAGWGASLQLVGTSLIGMGDAELRSSIEDLNARSEPLYDFLAAQVLHRWSGPLQRVLAVASILERVEPTLVMAAVTAEDRLSRRRVEALLAEAERSGIISRTATEGRWWRFHPLVRDFLSSRLMQSTGRRTLLEMHLRVAKAAEPLDWAVSAHHYIEAEHRADGMRVLRESAIQALGTASWGAATALVDRMPDQPVPDAVTVLRAYNMAARGQVSRAVTLLERLAPSPDDTVAWGLTRTALASLYLVTGHLDGIREILSEIAGREDLAPVIVSLAGGVGAILEAHGGGSLSKAAEVFEEMAEEQARLGLTYFAAVSYHNAALAAFARGRYETALSMARRAVEQSSRTPSKHGIDSTYAVLALAQMELGNAGKADEHLNQTASGETALPDAQADAAWIAAATGETNTAWVLIEQATAAAREGPRTPGAHAAVQYSRVLALLVEGSVAAANRLMAEAQEGSVELDAGVRHSAMAALVSLVSEDRAEAARLAREGLVLAESQGANHWSRWLRLLEAVGAGDGDGFRRALANVTANAKLSTLVLADAIAMGLGLVDITPPDVVTLMRAWPERWLPALRRVVQGPDRSAGMAAAALLSTIGTMQDVALLSEFERKHIRQAARRTFSKKLARHVNPTLVVHDLGRLQIEIAQRLVPLSQSRRKAASLLAFLASRPSHSATRDQVLEAMWPSQSPEGAANSLHQTLFFLRREIDPWYEDGNSVDYLVVEPDVIYLDPDLVLVDSAAFFRQLSSALASNQLADLGAPLLRDYAAKFALDFEYEDWSTAWRDQLHGLFLDAAQGTSERLLADGRAQLAVDVAERALAVDATALDLEATLVVALHAAGATAAARYQYRHFAKAHEEETGEAPPALSSMLASRGQRGT